MEVPSDEQLLAEHKKGQTERFEVLVRRHSKNLYRFLVHFTGNETMADDLVQEAFLQVYRSVNDFDPSRRFKPWLYTIAANKARDLMRSRRRRSEVPLDAQIEGEKGEGQTFLTLLPDASEGPTVGLELEEERLFVRKMLAGMPDHLREVLILSYYQHLPYKEIAEILNVPLGTIKSRLHAAIKHLATVYRRSMKAEEGVINNG